MPGVINEFIISMAAKPTIAFLIFYLFADEGNKNVKQKFT